MSDTEDMWRQLSVLTQRTEAIEEWIKSCPPSGAIVSHDAVVQLKSSVDQHAARLEAISAQLGAPDPTASVRAKLRDLDDRVTQLDATVGTPDVDDATVIEQLNRLHDAKIATDKMIAELAGRLDDRRPAAPAVMAGDGGTAIHTLHVERLSLALDDGMERRADAGHRIAVNLATAHAKECDGRRRLVTPERIRDADGDDLDLVADILGLARKALDDHDGEFEGDESLRIRCATAYFAQNMTREAAALIAKQAAIACKTKHSYTIRASDPDWCPHPWVVDAVMAAAGAQQPENERHQAGRTAARELEQALGYDQGSLSWPAMLECVRETIVQRNEARAALDEQNTENVRLRRQINGQVETIERLEQRCSERVMQLATMEAWRNRLAEVLDVKDDIHIIEAAVNRFIAQDGADVPASAHEVVAADPLSGL